MLTTHNTLYIMYTDNWLIKLR